MMRIMSSIEQNISPDSWIKIFSYLLASDAIRLIICNKYLLEKVGENEFVWRDLLSWGDAQLLRQVVNQSLCFKKIVDTSTNTNLDNSNSNNSSSSNINITENNENKKVENVSKSK